MCITSVTYGWTDRQPRLGFAHVAILNHRFVAFHNCCVSDILKELTLLEGQISSTLLDLASSQTLQATTRLSLSYILPRPWVDFTRTALLQPSL